MSDVASRSVRARSGVHALLLTAGALVSTALVAWLAGRAGALLGGRQGAWRVDDVVELSVAVAGVLVAAWLAVSAAVAAACLVARLVGASWSSGERLVHRWAPLVVRRALVVAVGAGLGLGLTTTAQAATAPEPAPVAAVAATDDLGWVVTAPGATADALPAPATAPPGGGAVVSGAGSAGIALAGSSGGAAGTGVDDGSTTVVADGGAGAVAATPTHATLEPDAGRLAGVTPVRASVPATAAPSTVVVVRGDTLWGIAARHLPPDASDAEIARAWPTWYEANRGVVGDDPDVLLPGQVLTVPAGVQR